MQTCCGLPRKRTTTSRHLIMPPHSIMFLPGGPHNQQVMLLVNKRRLEALLRGVLDQQHPQHPQHPQQQQQQQQPLLEQAEGGGVSHSLPAPVQRASSLRSSGNGAFMLGLATGPGSASVGLTGGNLRSQILKVSMVWACGLGLWVGFVVGLWWRDWRRVVGVWPFVVARVVPRVMPQAMARLMAGVVAYVVAWVAGATCSGDTGMGLQWCVRRACRRV